MKRYHRKTEIAWGWTCTVGLLLCSVAWTQVKAQDEWIPTESQLENPLCEACKVYNEVVFDNIVNLSPIDREQSMNKVCDEYRWLSPESRFSEKMRAACLILDSLNSRTDNTSIMSVWKDVSGINHNSVDVLVESKREACVNRLKVCTDNDFQKLDRERTNCEKCEMIVRDIYEINTRTEVYNTYQKGRFYEYSMDMACVDLERRHFPAPIDSGTILPLEKYCIDLIHTHGKRIHDAFMDSDEYLDILLETSCKPPCNVGVEKDEL